MLSDKAKGKLIEKVGCPKDVEFKIERKSKWIVIIKMVEGLCLYASFKFDCKNATMERII